MLILHLKEHPIIFCTSEEKSLGNLKGETVLRHGEHKNSKYKYKHFKLTSQVTEQINNSIDDPFMCLTFSLQKNLCFKEAIRVYLSKLMLR